MQQEQQERQNKQNKGTDTQSWDQDSARAAVTRIEECLRGHYRLGRQDPLFTIRAIQRVVHNPDAVRGRK